jgi:hypothetical protein
MIFATEKESYTFSQIANTPDQAVGAIILKEAYKKLGININFLVVSGKRALLQSSRGQSDGEVHRIEEVGDTYPSLLRVQTPINYIEQNVFTIKDYDIQSCEDMRPLRIGIVRGVKHAELCTAGFSKLKVYSNSLELIKVLNERKVDVIITAYFNGLIQIKKLGYQKIKAIRPSLSRKNLYHYVHKKNKEIIPLIDEKIKEMMKSGEIEKIRKREMIKIEDHAKQY